MVQSSRNCPTTAFSAALFVLSFVALSPSPNAITLIFLLGGLQLAARAAYQREQSFQSGVRSWLCCTAGVAVSHVLPSVHALSTPFTSMVLLGIMSGFTSAISVGIVHLDLMIAQSRTSWASLVFFPALWAAAWGTVSLISPVGRLITWSPVTGISPYTWTSQFLGPWGIDFLVGAWSVVIVEVTSKYLVTTRSMTNEHLISFEANEVRYTDEPVSSPSPEPSSPDLRRACAFGALLLALMLPSYTTSFLPLPTFTANTTPLTVACALPRTRLPDGRFSPATLDDYIAESKKLTSASIIIWPEGAVKFETPAAREAGFKQLNDSILHIQQSVYIGISFEEIDSSTDESRTTLKRNGFALVNFKEGIVIEYYKRHLVPIAESFSIAPSISPPPIHTIHLPSPSKTRHTDWAPGPNYTRPISVTSSICLDFATPSSFTSLESRPSLILAPARTWHEAVGLAMWNQAKQRAQETGSTVVWCDGGEGGLSGVIGHGYGEPTQVGEGSWIKTIGLSYPFDERRTAFIQIGEYGAMLLLCLFFGGGWAVDALVRGKSQQLTLAVVSRRFWEFRDWAMKVIEQARQRRQVVTSDGGVERGEQQHLLD